MPGLDSLRPRLESASGWIAGFANDRFRSIDHCEPNPREIENLDWNRNLQARWETISAEWLAFRAAGGRLPSVGHLTRDTPGNVGAWDCGVLVAWGGVSTLLSRQFPLTLVALAQLPGLRSASWSVLAPGAEIPEHCGPNPGVLRLHLGVDCPVGAMLTIGSQSVPFCDGGTILFDDTFPHSSRNASDRERVTLFCELMRPLPTPWRQLNGCAQRLMTYDPRARGLIRNTNAWHAALNPLLAAQR